MALSRQDSQGTRFGGEYREKCHLVRLTFSLYCIQVDNIAWPMSCSYNNCSFGAVLPETATDQEECKWAFTSLQRDPTICWNRPGFIQSGSNSTSVNMPLNSHPGTTLSLSHLLPSLFTVVTISIEESSTRLKPSQKVGIFLVPQFFELLSLVLCQ